MGWGGVGQAETPTCTGEASTRPDVGVPFLCAGGGGGGSSVGTSPPIPWCRSLLLQPHEAMGEVGQHRELFVASCAQLLGLKALCD